MAKVNTSSVDTDDGYKIAHMGKQNKLAESRNFKNSGAVVEKQVVNARKAKDVEKKKALAKRRKDLAKAAKKKNKK